MPHKTAWQTHWVWAPTDAPVFRRPLHHSLRPANLGIEGNRWSCWVLWASVHWLPHCTVSSCVGSKVEWDPTWWRRWLTIPHTVLLEDCQAGKKLRMDVYLSEGKSFFTPGWKYSSAINLLLGGWQEPQAAMAAYQSLRLVVAVGMRRTQLWW